MEPHPKDMARDAERDGGRFERIPAADAAVRLRAALVASADESLPPVLTAAPEHDALYSMLPLAVRRMMTMPGGDEPATLGCPGNSGQRLVFDLVEQGLGCRGLCRCFRVADFGRLTQLTC